MSSVITAPMMIIINSGRPINPKQADTIHERQFGQHANDPTNAIDHARPSSVIGRVTGEPRQETGNDHEGFANGAGMRRGFQLFP